MAGPKEVGFEFTWNQPEHVRFVRAVARHRQGGRWMRWIMPTVVLVVFAFVALLPVIHPGGNMGPVWRAFAPWLAIMLGWMALLSWGLPYLAAVTFRRQNHCSRHPMRRVITPQGVRAECETTTSAVSWAGVHHVVETPEFFLFYVTPACAFQLPTRAIGSPTVLSELRRVLRAHLGARAMLLGLAAAAAP
jgi:hypothetical protein